MRTNASRIRSQNLSRTNSYFVWLVVAIPTFFYSIALVVPKSNNPFFRESSLQNEPIVLGSQVLLDRASYNSKATRPSYEPFYRNARDKSRSIYVSEVLDPPRYHVRAVVCIYAGQQGFDNGMYSKMTGQKHGYKSDWPSASSKKSDVEAGSLAEHVLKSGIFHKHRTSVSMFFDQQFEYQDSTSSKDANLKAHAEYILNKVGPRTEIIFLAGHSRGGCLIMRIAKILTEKHPQITVIVTAYDPVCVVPGQLIQPEMGITGKYIRNPVNSNAEVATTNMTEQFKTRSFFALRSFLSGQKINGWMPVVSFGHSEFDEPEQSLWLGGQGPWYTQSFHRENHGDITYKYYEIVVEFLRTAIKRNRSKQTKEN